MPTSTPLHPMASRKGFWRGTFLFMQAMINIPVNSIFIYGAIYWGSLFYAMRSKNLYLMSMQLIYSSYILLDKSPTKPGGWNLSPSWHRWCRNFPGYRWLAEYFDQRIIKTKDLDPKQQYIFCYHPHGIIGTGCCTALATNAVAFEKHFPGIERRSVTLNATFLTPIFREWILALGFISANKSTLKNTLESESVVLIAGGAAEALHTKQDSMKLYLKNRKGFVRLAMETKKPLIPCIGFGENEIFDILVTSKSDAGWKGLIWKLQELFMRVTSVSPPIITNPFPRPVQLTTVVGTPLVMDTNKSLDENHLLYLQALRTLYDQHAKNLGYGHVKLEIV